ncbi:MAG: hypothetical protein Q7S12_01890 [bacterium]|nr:hypothetical protein [bacterium]
MVKVIKYSAKTSGLLVFFLLAIPLLFVLGIGKLILKWSVVKSAKADVPANITDPDTPDCEESSGY